MVAGGNLLTQALGVVLDIDGLDPVTRCHHVVHRDVFQFQKNDQNALALARYTWQTPQFYAAMVQYLTGAADAQSVWQALPTTLDFSSQPASFNWANLR